MDDTLAYPYGWSEVGTRCFEERLGHRTCRVSMAAALCQGQVLSPLTFEGYCDAPLDAPLIEAWFSQQLIHALRPGQVVILDNASFHHKERLAAILAQVGCTLLPLPRYSPDLNDIEPLWNSLKSKIAHTRHLHPDFRTAVDAAFV